MEYNVPEGLAKLAQEGLITEDEQAFLLATYEVLESDDNPLAKEANLKKRIGEIGLGNLLFAGAASLPVVGMGINYALDPVRESMRYRNMQALPAKRIHLSPEQAEMMYVKDNPNRDQMSDEALRKAFAIVHRYAPEITRTPELAHDFLNQNTGVGVERLIHNAVNFARNPVEVNQKREQVKDMRRTHIRNTATGMKVVLDPLNPKPVEAPQDEQQILNRVYAETMGKHLAYEELRAQGIDPTSGPNRAPNGFNVPPTNP